MFDEVMHFWGSTIEGRRVGSATRTVLAVIVLGLSAIFNNGRADESTAAENTAADSAVEGVTTIGEALTAREFEQPVRVKGLRERVKDMPPILRDAIFKINFRAYRFERETVSDERDFANTLGGEIFFETGRFLRIAKVGLSYYSSNLFGNSENPGATGLVAPDGSDLNVLGQAYLQLGDRNGWYASLYRRGIKVPYLDSDDSRMIPRTHETYFVAHNGERRDFGFGHFTRTKLKNSERFIPMSEAAGAPDTDKGVSVAGAKFDIHQDATLGLFNLYGWDTYNTLYAEGHWSSYFLRSLGTKVSVQYTDQRSVGNQLVGAFRTWHAGIKWSGSVKSAVLTLAYTQIGKEASIRFPWGGFPSYNWGMLEDFNRPGERAWRLGISLTGTPWGHDAWSGFVNFTHGDDARDIDTGGAAPDVTEGAFTIDFKPESGSLKGLWVRFRAGRADFDDGNDVTNIRFIVNYALPIL
jgi:hypothetical protein